MTKSRGPEYERIRTICVNLSGASTRGELGSLLAREILLFSLFDLQVIMGRLRYEIHRLPYAYRRSAGPFLLSQVVDAHHSLITLYTSGAFNGMSQPVGRREEYLSYLAMIPGGCNAFDIKAEYLPQFHSPMHRLFYYLLAGFVMFVLEEPGHPTGTPFPGGLKVEERDGVFYCPVRDKEKDVFYSLCNFCPARQTEGV